MKLIISSSFLIMIANTTYAAQTCRLESEVPSTTPSSRFIDNLDGTIIDTNTDLTWQKCPMGKTGHNCDQGTEVSFNWENALEEAQNNNLAGFSDWRLPNINELESIIEQRCSYPAINELIFPNVTFASVYWSSTPYVYADNIGYSWSVHFNTGLSQNTSRSTSFSKVRLIRSR